VKPRSTPTAAPNQETPEQHVARRAYVSHWPGRHPQRRRPRCHRRGACHNPIGFWSAGIARGRHKVLRRARRWPMRSMTKDCRAVLTCGLAAWSWPWTGRLGPRLAALALGVRCTGAHRFRHGLHELPRARSAGAVAQRPGAQWGGLWPAAGLSLAALLLLPTRSWGWVLSAVALAEVGGDVAHGYPVVAALGWALGNTVEPLVGAMLLRRLGQRGRPADPR
jgi:hypothetical protein